MTTLGADEWAGMDLSVRRGNDHDPSWFSGLANLEAHYDMIIVGAGISGCVFAERGSRELGLRSLIIDKRDHIGGNCYDFINKHGFRVSQYGVHLFHTKFDRVWEYVNRFGEWIPYEHRVKGKVDVGEGYKVVPIPPSQETVNTLFHANVNSEKEMEAWLDARGARRTMRRKRRGIRVGRGPGRNCTRLFLSTTPRNSGTSGRKSSMRGAGSHSRAHEHGRPVLLRSPPGAP